MKFIKIPSEDFPDIQSLEKSIKSSVKCRNFFAGAAAMGAVADIGIVTNTNFKEMQGMHIALLGVTGLPLCFAIIGTAAIALMQHALKHEKANQPKITTRESLQP